MHSKPLNKELGRLGADTIRVLAMEGVQKANSGHPGMPMGMADCAFILWTRYLRFCPTDPEWPNRDRFILSAGHGSMLLYALLHLSGFDVTMDDLQQFRQWGSRTPGHPERGCLPGVETTTGPLGQGFANGVGMALASKIISRNFNDEKGFPFSERIYAIVSDGDLMEGVASEAASIAGHLKLGNIIFLYDDNHITIEGDTGLAFTEDVAKRFESYGWHTLAIDGHNHEEIDAAIMASIQEEERPSLILARTHIAYGSPNKHDDASSHGSPLGTEEVEKTKKHLHWPKEPTFYIPDQVRELFRIRVAELKSAYDHWCSEFDSWKESHPELFERWSEMLSKALPEDLESHLWEAVPEKEMATRASGQAILQRVAELIPGVYGGSADLAPSTKTIIKISPSIAPGEFSGRNLHFGIREHGMGGILNGMALYGGFIPYGSTFLVFSDYMRPSIRLAALMEAQVIYIFTHDSLFVGEDGPTHQPVEHLAALRAIPNLAVIRPADGAETAVAWSIALKRKQGPSAIVLTRQTVPRVVDTEHIDPGAVSTGGYILSDPDEKADVIIVASGSEVSVALESRDRLEKKGLKARIVSMPCLELFREQSASYRESVIPSRGIPVVVVEAGVFHGWYGITQEPLHFIGMTRFGASAPAETLRIKFGFTGESVADRVVEWLNTL